MRAFEEKIASLRNISVKKDEQLMKLKSSLEQSEKLVKRKHWRMSS